ncbi:hypothetical protein AK830_g7200 [Neonectria ditissima]|uniref:Zn(2)-C6 fungal-type domain-containing protein n=1 Tax=Neonectria ditissima TaxID=78410 RepID=A0A0N8H6M0_9HYPO|nr:hypothetical protein AK830_g7200 [Neonectria ditissima]
MTKESSPASDEGVIGVQSKPPHDHNKPKLSRISTKKVRTGCITCKKRRVKCDEAKPHCGNCLKSRGHCEGYAEQSKKPKSSGPLQIRWDSKQTPNQITRAASPLIQVKLDPDSLDFRDAKGLLYFQEFVDLVQGPWITAGSSSGLWDATLPQLARNNATLRHAAVGIGALSMWYRQSGRNTLRKLTMPVHSIAEGDAHYFYGVASYCHALKLLSQQASVQDGIFLSVLALCFETLRGNRKVALDHVNHGSALLLSMLTDQDASRHVAAFAPNPKPLLAKVADIFIHLVTQARFVFRATPGSGPSLPNFTKGLRDRKHTLESFIVLICQLSASSTVTHRIPTVFKSLDEFEEYCAQALRDRSTMGPVIIDIIRTSDILTSIDHNDIGAFWERLDGDYRIKEFIKASALEMQSLNAAFLPLFNQVMLSDTKTPEYLRAVHLRLQYLGVYAFENPTQYHNFEALHAQTPLFREYLSLAEVAFHITKRDIANPAQHLSLQSGLSWRLLLVALFCRDPLVRDHAILMLKDYPGEDGLWSTRALYTLAMRNRDLERMNAVEGTLKEQWQRLWRREYLFEHGGDRAIFCFLAKNEMTGEWELVEETAEVQEDSEAIWERRPLTASGRLLMEEMTVL